MDKRMEADIQRCIQNMSEDPIYKEARARAAYASGYLEKYPELRELMDFIAHGNDQII